MVRRHTPATTELITANTKSPHQNLAPLLTKQIINRTTQHSRPYHAARSAIQKSINPLIQDLASSIQHYVSRFTVHVSRFHPRPLHHLLRQIVTRPRVADDNLLHAPGGINDHRSEVVGDNAGLLGLKYKTELLANRHDINYRPGREGPALGIILVSLAEGLEDSRSVELGRMKSLADANSSARPVVPTISVGSVQNCAP